MWLGNSAVTGSASRLNRRHVSSVSERIVSGISPVMLLMDRRSRRRLAILNSNFKSPERASLPPIPTDKRQRHFGPLQKKSRNSSEYFIDTFAGKVLN